MGGSHAITSQQQPSQPPELLAVDRSNLADRGSGFARPFGRGRRLSELVVRGRLGRIYGRQQTVGVGAEPFAPCSEKPNALRSEGVSPAECGKYLFLEEALCRQLVMPGLVPGIHVFGYRDKEDVDGRDEARP